LHATTTRRSEMSSKVGIRSPARYGAVIDPIIRSFSV